MGCYLTLTDILAHCNAVADVALQLAGQIQGLLSILSFCGVRASYMILPEDAVRATRSKARSS